jgi:hypothetical protein
MSFIEKNTFCTVRVALLTIIKDTKKWANLYQAVTGSVANPDEF